MFFFRRNLQLLKTKTRLINKVQFNITKQMNMKRNVRYPNKLGLEKYIDKHIPDKEFRKDAQKMETKKDFIIEFNSELDWEESVLKSPIPVVVKFYAE
jgi:hypothetical protein